MKRPAQFIVRHETPAERCEICHQADQFDPATGVCTRCRNVPELATVLLPELRVDWIAAGISPELQAQLQAELSEDERLLWVGRPNLRVVDFRGNIALIVASASLIWVCLANNTKPGWMLVLAMAFLFFLWIGLMAFWGKFKARRAVYAVSNQRAIILIPGRTGEISSFVRAHLTGVEARSAPDGLGNLFLNYQGLNNFFYSIENATSVEQIIRANLLKSEH